MACRTHAGRDSTGCASPGRALQGVKDKLEAYYAKQATQAQVQQQARPAPGAVIARAASLAALIKPAVAVTSLAPAQATLSEGSDVFRDASSEIADIDERLHALQSFLKAAKSSVTAGGV